MSEASHDQYAKGDSGTFGETITNLTPGVKNIQAAYGRAGATHNHTPGYAGKLGSQEQHDRNSHARESASLADKKEGVKNSGSGGGSGNAVENREPSAIGQFFKDWLAKR